jgi:hypothetical protein
MVFWRPFFDIQEAKRISNQAKYLIEKKQQRSEIDSCGSSTFVSTSTKRTSICLMLPTVAEKQIKSLSLNGLTYCRDENGSFPMGKIQIEVCDKNPEKIFIKFGK